MTGALMLMSVALFADKAPVRRGPFAFHYAPRLSDEELRWYSRFEILVTHDPLPREQVRRLHAAGTKLVMYEWAVAFYESRATAWQRSLLKRGKKSLLNNTALTGGIGSSEAPAWYFDPATDEHRVDRADDLARRVAAHGYDGVFLDTTTFASVHPEAQKEFERRHPTEEYDVAFSRFLVELRKKMRGGLIITNQGYRSPANYLPYVDRDLTESLITRPRGDAFALRPWNDRADPWNSILFLMRTLIAPLTARYPRVHFDHLNYISGPDADTIDLVIAVTKIFDGEGYVAAPETSAENDPVYFRDFGKPLAARVELEGGDVLYRVFDHGTIVVNATSRDIHIEALRVTIPAASHHPRAFFIDR